MYRIPGRGCGARRLWSILFVLVFCGGSAAAAIPGQENPNAYTNHRLHKDRLDYMRRSLVESYKSVGQRDVKWDGPAVDALEALARYFSDNAVEPMYRAAKPTGADDVLIAAEAAVGAGCTDPLVLYAHAVGIQDTGKGAQARPVL